MADPMKAASSAARAAAAFAAAPAKKAAAPPAKKAAAPAKAWQAEINGVMPISRFLLKIEAVEIGVFSEVSGLELTVGVEEFAEGGQNGYLHRVPGRITWPNIVFRRGITQGNALFDWVNRSSGEGFAAAGNKITRSTGAITAVDFGGKPLRSWNLVGAFPVRWKGPEFNVAGDGPLQEELEIAHHGFTAKTHT